MGKWKNRTPKIWQDQPWNWGKRFLTVITAQWTEKLPSQVKMNRACVKASAGGRIRNLHNSPGVRSNVSQHFFNKLYSAIKKKKWKSLKKTLSKNLEGRNPQCPWGRDRLAGLALPYFTSQTLSTDESLTSSSRACCGVLPAPPIRANHVGQRADC